MVVVCAPGLCVGDKVMALGARHPSLCKTRTQCHGVPYRGTLAVRAGTVALVVWALSKRRSGIRAPVGFVPRGMSQGTPLPRPPPQAR